MVQWERAEVSDQTPPDSNSRSTPVLGMWFGAYYIPPPCLSFAFSFLFVNRGQLQHRSQRAIAETE